MVLYIEFAYHKLYLELEKIYANLTDLILQTATVSPQTKNLRSKK